MLRLLHISDVANGETRQSARRFFAAPLPLAKFFFQFWGLTKIFPTDIFEIQWCNWWYFSLPNQVLARVLRYTAAPSPRMRSGYGLSQQITNISLKLSQSHQSPVCSRTAVASEVCYAYGSWLYLVKWWYLARSKSGEIKSNSWCEIDYY